MYLHVYVWFRKLIICLYFLKTLKVMPSTWIRLEEGIESRWCPYFRSHSLSIDRSIDRLRSIYLSLSRYIFIYNFQQISVCHTVLGIVTFISVNCHFCYGAILLLITLNICVRTQADSVVMLKWFLENQSTLSEINFLLILSQNTIPLGTKTS